MTADNLPMGYTWMGRNVDDLSLDELRIALKQLIKINHDDRESHMRSFRMMADIAKARRS